MYKIYGYHKGIADTRFDAGMTQWLQYQLQKIKNVPVEVILGNGGDVYTNDGENFVTPHGSLCIIENCETKKFHVSDFGDNCADVFPLTRFKNFGGMTLGQFNRHKIDKDIPDEHIRQLIRPGYYPETNWNFGTQVFDSIQEYRNQITLDERLHFRGSIYQTLRDCVLILGHRYNNEVYIGSGRLPFEDYLREVASFKMTLSMGLSPYSSDLCFRDIEMFGIGIPVIRPTLHVELADPLIPNVHYIACDVELDPYTLWTTDSTTAANIIYERYKAVVHDEDFLSMISKNAREWYLRNIAEPTPAVNLVSWITV